MTENKIMVLAKWTVSELYIHQFSRMEQDDQRPYCFCKLNRNTICISRFPMLLSSEFFNESFSVLTSSGLIGPGSSRAQLSAHSCIAY